MRPTTQAALAALATSLLLLPSHATAQRAEDPVILQGADVPRLLGRAPGRIVAFRHTGSAWQQVPVQVDERVVVPVDQVRQVNGFVNSILAYADPDTFTGADTDPTVDADDELCFMARDTGPRSTTFADPAGVLPNTRVELAVTDPLTGNGRYLYLFVSDGTLQPGAGRDYVRYSFNLASGPYKTTYNLSGSNPENSPVTTSQYRLRFLDRWIMDVLQVRAGNATEVDVLDRDKFQFAPGVCNRSTDTFSQAGGAAVANIDGPVRAIRSVIGANSGGTTQRDWICYRSRVDIVSYLRVHPIGGTFLYFDYSPAASGMTYFDNLNRSGLAIDGQPDAAQTGVIDWQLVTGPQGSLTHALILDTDIPNLQVSSYYDDDSSPSWAQCTGDGSAFAAAGPTTGAVANTDPNRGPAQVLTTTRVLYVDAPGRTVADAEARNSWARSPLQVQATGRVRMFGTSCAGPTANPTLTASGAPMAGGELQFEATGLAPNRAVTLILGASNQQWGNFSLPLDLFLFGMPGCQLYTDVGVLLITSSSTSSWQLPVTVPADASIVDSSTFAQIFADDPAANPTGIVASNGLEIVLGR